MKNKQTIKEVNKLIVAHEDNIRKATAKALQERIKQLEEDLTECRKALGKCMNRLQEKENE